MIDVFDRCSVSRIFLLHKENSVSIDCINKGTKRRGTPPGGLPLFFKPESGLALRVDSIFAGEEFFSIGRTRSSNAVSHTR